MKLSQRLGGALMAQPEPVWAEPLKDWPFGPWLPDAPEHANPGCARAQGVFPFGPHGYRPFPNLSAYSGAMTNRAQGAAAMPGSDGFTYVYAGDTSDLFTLVDTTFTNATRTSGGVYTVAADEFWEFLKFNNTVLATAIGNAVQGMTIGSANFANQFTSTLLPQCRHMCRGGRFLMLGDTRESGVDFPTRIRWGQIDSLVNMDVSAADQSGFRDIDGDGGWIKRLIGGSYVTIYQEHLIQRAEYIGSPVIWDFDVVEQNRGTLASYSVIPLGRIHFYLAHDGFFLFDGLESHPISDRKVIKYFFDNAAASFYFRMCGAVFPEEQVVAWAFVTTSASGSNPNPDRILLYHWPSGWWAFVNVTVEWLFNSLSPGTTLEGLDAIDPSVDALPFSLDSRYWTGGVREAMGFDASNQLGRFTGSNLAVIIETAIRQLFPGRRTRVTGCHVLSDGGSPTVAISSQARLQDTQTFGTAVAINTEGYAPLHAAAKYSAFQVNMPAASSFTHLTGIKPIAAPMGQR